jgi:transcriptional regulator with XRE-family HTH domain
LRPLGEWLNQPGGLAERLERIRKAAGLTGDRLAAQLGWARSKVPKIENGRQLPTEADIKAWTEACGQPEAEAELLGMLTDAQTVYRQWRLGRGGHEALQGQYDALVRSASRIRNFQIMLVPGLLQTPEYARYRALEAVRLHGADPGGVEATVAARMRRQEILYDTSKTFTFVITDAALRYLLCPRQVMFAQLDRLATVSEFGNVMLGIIPPAVELPVAPMVGFLMADETTIVETFTSAITLAARESPKYAQITDELMAEAATGDEARRLITAAAASLRITAGPGEDGRA